MQLADALSRCLARASQEIKLDMRVDYIAFTKPWIEKLKDSTQRDPILVTVYQLTQQLANSQKMVLSGNRKGSIKQTNTSQVLVSETVPDRRVQLSR